MSQENVEALRAVYAEWAEGNFGAGADLFSEELRVNPLVEPSPQVGRKAVADYMRDFLTHWVDYTIEAADLADLGNSVLVTERQHGTGKTSGIEMEMTFYALWTFREGRVVHVSWESDRQRALGAARADDSPATR